MNARHWLLGMMVTVAGLAHADMDVTGQNLDQFARTSAQTLPGARESVPRGTDGTVKWAGVWVNREQACPNGRLGDDGRRLIAEGGRFAKDHGAHLILFAPRADAAVMERDAKLAAVKIEVRANDLIGEHCYLVIQR